MTSVQATHRLQQFQSRDGLRLQIVSCDDQYPASVPTRACLSPVLKLVSAAGAGLDPASRRSERRILPLNDPAERFGCRSSKVSSPAVGCKRTAKGRAGLEPARGCLTGTCSAAELSTRFSRTAREDVRFVGSAQRESNPHIRHGKATGCRYIMGACCLTSRDDRI